MITKETVVDLIQITEMGAIQARRATYFVEDGVRISQPEYHRVAYEPGDDISHEDEKVKTHAAVAWTEDVIAAFKATQVRTAALTGTETQ